MSEILTDKEIEDLLFALNNYREIDDGPEDDKARILDQGEIDELVCKLCKSGHPIKCKNCDSLRRRENPIKVDSCDFCGPDQQRRMFYMLDTENLDNQYSFKRYLMEFCPMCGVELKTYVDAMHDEWDDVLKAAEQMKGKGF